VSTLAAGRAAKQTRRAGLLKAVGATPGLIAAVLLTEYLILAVLADVLGLTLARQIAPKLINPSGSLIAVPGWPSRGIIVMTTILAIAIATLTTVVPTVRALRTDTVDALADTIHRPGHHAPLSRLGALLPTPLLLAVSPFCDYCTLTFRQSQGQNPAAGVLWVAVTVCGTCRQPCADGPSTGWSSRGPPTPRTTTPASDC